MTEQELLELYAKILIIAERNICSFKDACHRHYMTQVERVRVADEHLNAWKEFESRMDNSIDSLIDRFNNISNAE